MASSSDPRLALLARELSALLRLTSAEATIAGIRRAQARTADIAKELTENAAHSRERAQALSAALSRLGVAPAVLAPLAGRVTALLKAQFEQLESPSGALLGDLALEHQLLERTRFARSLASQLGEQTIAAVLDRLETAHTATIAWIEARLDEVAAGAAPMLRATPPQVAVGALQTAALLPARSLSSVVNRVAGLLRTPPQLEQLEQRLAETAARIRDRAQEAAGSVIDLTRGDATSAPPAEDDAPPAVPTEHDLPIKEYGRLAGDVIMRHTQDMDSVTELRAVLAFEQAHKARPGVMDALTARIGELSPATP